MIYSIWISTDLSYTLVEGEEAKPSCGEGAKLIKKFEAPSWENATPVYDTLIESGEIEKDEPIWADWELLVGRERTKPVDREMIAEARAARERGEIGESVEVIINRLKQEIDQEARSGTESHMGDAT